ncbi:MAG: hypothetical protein ACJAVV_002146 [Alphaproteobacteria bacterium]|jgi:hypothetical protein
MPERKPEVAMVYGAKALFLARLGEFFELFA